MNKLLSTITYSKKRESLLVFLRDGPKTLEEIRASLNVTSSGMIPQIRKLEEQNLVLQEGKIYALTDTGMVIAEVFNSLMKTIDIIEKYQEFWKTHDIKAVPFPLLKRIYEIRDCRIIESKISELYDPHKEFMKYLFKTKKFLGIAPIYHREYPHLFLQLAENGTDVSILVTRDILAKIQNENKGELSKFIRMENALFYVSDEPIRLASAVLDNFFSMSFFFKNGGYDSQNELISSDNAAIKWGEELFEHFLKRSNRIRRA